MRLKRLELQGFKSFLDRTILTFESGITGVVGPNGCGKSNIVDAILWVMGEQSPKHLRGESMTDVIFAGSDSRAPTSMAEVSLILDKQGVVLPPQFAAFEKGDEIAVTRRIYRDGTGEFLINRSTCRLKDIHELFMDTGVGRRAYSIIEQGQIDRMINVKPEERRLIFEEVAGITKYKAKRKEAERKLESTRANLLRLNDILVELEKQIRSLKIQATRARKYKELKSELEVADLFLLGRALFDLRQAITELEGRKDQVETEQAELDARWAEREAQVTELEVTRLDQEKAYEALAASERDLMLALQKIESQIGLLEERRKHLETQNETFRTEQSELEAQLEALRIDKDREEQERDQLVETLSALEVELSSGEKRLSEAQEKRRSVQGRKDAAELRLAQAAQSAVALETRRQGVSAQIQDGERALSGLTEQLSEVLERQTALQEALRQADDRIQACAARTREAEQEISSCHAECEAASKTLSELEEELFRFRESFHSKRSRLESLRELEANFEGYSPTAREILQKLGGTGIQATPLGEVLQPSPELEEHLEMLLGQDMNALLVASTGEAERLVRFVEEKSLERVRVVALDETVEGLEASAPQGLEPLISRVRVRAGFEAAARKWLGSVYLCPDSDVLFALREANPGKTIIAEASRTMGYADRSVAAGVLPKKMGVFARKREIEELAQVSATLESEIQSVTQKREECLLGLQSREKTQAELKDKLSRLHMESVENRKEREKIQLEIGRADKDKDHLTRENERRLAQLEEWRSKVAEWEGQITALSSERSELENEKAEAEAEMASLIQTVEALTQALSSQREKRSVQAERASAIESRILKIDSEIAQATRRLTTLETQLQRNEQELQSFENNRSELITEKEGRTQELSRTQVKLADTKAAFNETCERLQTFRDELGELQKRREAVAKEHQEIELKLAAERSSFEHTKGISVERYQQEASPIDTSSGLDLEKLPLLKAEVTDTWPQMEEPARKALLEEHVKNLRDKVSRYGEVNLTAIAEFDEIQKRYDFMMEQKTDLEKSIQILEEAIQKIDESTKSRFSETFDAVQKKFGEIFPILFGGGKGELVLTAPDNMLESGVDIMVQPPGKRLQSISLLSGGEKALTAVSLVLAIFARKPSPFCLLDEVDAPLDDANVSRFNTVIRKMSEKTQFIVITHNKKTMEIAEALYGVTMEKAGVSKMTSVRMN